MEDKVSLSVTELNDVINSAIYKAMDAYWKESKKDVLIPRNVAMRLLHKSASTLWRWEKTHYLVPIRQGASVMYSSRDLSRLGIEIDV